MSGHASTILNVDVYQLSFAANVSERSSGSIGVEVISAAIRFRCPPRFRKFFSTFNTASRTRSWLFASSSSCKSSNSTRSGRSEPRTFPRAFALKPTAFITPPEDGESLTVGRMISLAFTWMLHGSPSTVSDFARCTFPSRRRIGTAISGKSSANASLRSNSANTSRIIEDAFPPAAHTEIT